MSQIDQSNAILLIICCHSGVANLHGSISVSGNQLLVFKATFTILTVASLWLIITGALLHSVYAFSVGSGISKSVADGSIYMGILALSIIISLAIVSPALLLFQPLRLWRVIQAELQALTPRQRFRGKSYFTPNECSLSDAGLFELYTHELITLRLLLELVYWLSYSLLHLPSYFLLWDQLRLYCFSSH